MKISSIIILPAALLLSMTAFADTFKNITQIVDVSDADRVKLDISVGELDIEVYDGEEIQLDVDIEAQRSWWFGRRRNVDDIELDIDGRGSSVYIGLKENNLEQHWRIRLPAKLAVEIEIGVGDVHIEEFSNSLDMEIGVGAVRIDVDDIDYAVIHVSAGVGDATIRGFERRADNERNFISADAYYHGDGEHEIEIEVGVGDVQVRNN
jgi:hypothetical protein